MLSQFLLYLHFSDISNLPMYCKLPNVGIDLFLSNNMDVGASALAMCGYSELVLTEKGSPSHYFQDGVITCHHLTHNRLLPLGRSRKLVV